MKKTMLTAASLALVLAFDRNASVQAAVEYPQMKEGLWSIHMTTTSNPGAKVMDLTETICRNHAYDEYIHGLATKMAGCTVTKDGEMGGSWTIESDCKVGASVIHSHGTIKAIDADNVHAETHATYTPPAYGTSDSTIVQDQKFLGACPADMAPGDMKMANGTIRHLWKH